MPSLIQQGFSALAHALVPRVIKHRQEQILTEWLHDGEMHVVLVGTRSPLADVTRAGPCTVVIADGHFIVVDAGPGCFNKMAAMGLPTDDITAILLTHFHSDHICEIGEISTMSWAASGRPHKLPVYGPPGVKEVVKGFNIAYHQDAGYREDHHSTKLMRREHAGMEAHVVALPGGKNESGSCGAMVKTEVRLGSGGKKKTKQNDEKSGGVSVAGAAADGGARIGVVTPPPAADVVSSSCDQLRVTAFNVDHRPVLPAYGYRFEYRGRVVVISGDTCKCESLIGHSKGSDVLVMEVLQFFVFPQLYLIH